MPSIHPNTFAPRYVDLRKALADGRVTKAEVRTLIAPHYRQAWSDSSYFDSLHQLAQNTMRLPNDGRVHVTKGARQMLQQVLTWEAVLVPPTR